MEEASGGQLSGCSLPSVACNMPSCEAAVFLGCERIGDELNEASNDGSPTNKQSSTINSHREMGALTGAQIARRAGPTDNFWRVAAAAGANC